MPSPFLALAECGAGQRGIYQTWQKKSYWTCIGLIMLLLHPSFVCILHLFATLYPTVDSRRSSSVLTARSKETRPLPLATPSPPTKSFDFRGCDSSKLLILRGGNFMSIESYRESPGKFDSRTLSRKTLSRRTGRSTYRPWGPAARAT